MIAPVNARISPRNAFPCMNAVNGGQVSRPLFHWQLSLKPTMIAPTIAITIPIIATLSIGSLSVSGSNNATHNGVEVTSTTELATVVYSNEVIQLAKCSARKKPDSKIKPRWR